MLINMRKDLQMKDKGGIATLFQTSMHSHCIHFGVQELPNRISPRVCLAQYLTWQKHQKKVQ